MKNFFQQLLNVKLFFSPEKKIEEIIYSKALSLSRKKKFYLYFMVPDTLDGRFDMLCLIVSLFMFRFREIGKNDNKLFDSTKSLNQKLFDTFFLDMDLTLREMGVGDIGIAKRIKIMSEAFKGRLTVYSKALEKKDINAMSVYISRNIYRKQKANDNIKKFSKEVFEIYKRIVLIEHKKILAGKIKIENLI